MTQSLKKISKEISQNLDMDTEEMLSDLSLLWRGAATKSDIIKFIVENDIEMMNFRYVAEDGKLKALNFVINSLEHLDLVLTTGERVDGSSIFSFIGAGSSDLYVIPRYSTARVSSARPSPVF